MTIGWQFILAGIGTYLIRLSAIALVGHGVEIPRRAERTLRLIGPAVLASITANSLILDHARLNPRVSWYVATAVAVFIVWRLRSAAWAMVAAMAALWAIQQVGIR